MPSPPTHTLSLHDALPISRRSTAARRPRALRRGDQPVPSGRAPALDSRRPGTRVRRRRPNDPPRSRRGSRAARRSRPGGAAGADRKSTRLNSSHLGISYAVPPYPHSFPTRRSSDLSPLHSRSTTSSPSTRRPTRSFGSCPSARFSTSRYPSPTPKTKRPSEITSRVASCSAISTGWCSGSRSEEHTSELQSLRHLVCRPPLPTLFPYTTLFRSLAAPQPLDDLEPFDEATNPFLRVVPQRSILDVPVPESDAEDQTTLRDHVEGRELLGDLDRVVQREQIGRAHV